MNCRLPSRTRCGSPITSKRSAASSFTSTAPAPPHRSKDRQPAYDLQWQALAKKWDCALLGPSYHVQNEKIDLSPGGSEAWFDPRHGSEKTFLKAISEFAGKTGHPELNTVPWALWGHSGGGIWADVMACLHPDRVAVAWLRSGSAAMFRSKPEFPQPQVPEALYQIPMMCNPGAKEMGRGPFYGTLATFQEYRAHGAPHWLCAGPAHGS